MAHYDIVVAGAGPGGLTCARILAASGCRVLVCERNREIGPKVCAGGITWDGLLRRVPETLCEAVFSRQHVVTPRQRVVVRERNPMIATVDRRQLGAWMNGQAQSAGAVLRTGSLVTAVEHQTVTLQGADGRTERIRFDHLVGADGSSSLVRRVLGLPCRRLGVGVHAQLVGHFPSMEWHLSPGLFGSGYAWVFPHRASASVGAYALRPVMSPAQLRRALEQWAHQRQIPLARGKIRAALINCDYQGHRFGTIWLVGDAAGLASGLTGEGIFPALISGEAVASAILGREHDAAAQVLQRLLRRQRLHHRIVDMAAGGGARAQILLEMLVLLLRFGLLRFSVLEMAA